jgi:hypothetical protein
VATSHTLAVTLEWKKTKREVIYEVLRFWDHEVFRETEFCIAKDCGRAGGARDRMNEFNVMRWSGYAAHD